MAQKEADAADVTIDLLTIQSNALEAIQDYRRYLRNAENAGLPEVAYFVHSPATRHVAATALASNSATVATNHVATDMTRVDAIMRVGPRLAAVH
jgi:hypothetical protein